MSLLTTILQTTTPLSLTSIFLGKRRLILNRLLRTRPSLFFTPATCLLGLPLLPLGAGLATGDAAAAGGAAVTACALAAAAAALAGFALKE